MGKNYEMKEFFILQIKEYLLIKVILLQSGLRILLYNYTLSLFFL